MAAANTKAESDDELDSTVFVVYAVQIYSPAPQKSSIDIIGVFDSKTRAEEQQAAVQKLINEKNADNSDPRYDYVHISKQPVNSKIFHLS